MDYKAINNRLNERNIKLRESFPSALRRLAKTYKKTHNIPLLNDVYVMIRTSKQEISWWEHHPLSTQTKKTINMTLSA
jgi:hypothetical protein